MSFQECIVSVPLRGFWYSDMAVGVADEGPSVEFQSPYGDFGTLTQRYEKMFYKI